jgi:hypothetical protein
VVLPWRPLCIDPHRGRALGSLPNSIDHFMGRARHDRDAMGLVVVAQTYGRPDAPVA